jgi:DNA invertase Pin-like site-specific DNA recombinase
MPKLNEIRKSECSKDSIGSSSIGMFSHDERSRLGLAFIATLMDSGVEFIAVDNPHANKLTIHILAAVAQHEREIISARTSAALKAAKARGKRLGNPKLSEARRHAALAKKERADDIQQTCCR